MQIRGEKQSERLTKPPKTFKKWCTSVKGGLYQMGNPTTSSYNFLVSHRRFFSFTPVFHFFFVSKTPEVTIEFLASRKDLAYLFHRKNRRYPCRNDYTFVVNDDFFQ